ncbi:MAG: asparagine synthase (glutamine-hydrolyzing) [Candidatus Aminicenantes bacterium]|nr:MAG: asparagine synthase (glutamine-hydrolyzing) [Candidatus Aminicenantes bacterium]
MCGITGIFLTNRSIEQSDIFAVRRMMDVLVHRGPDDSGLFHDEHIVLGHRRLSIIDLSPAGHQPMSNEDKGIWITYNGEIYNYRELRKALIAQGHKFKSHSDTEVIIHGYEEWGIERLLQRLQGMFAFAIYDRRHLVLARDRLGIKPLYYSYSDGIFIFASEIKAILASKLVSKEVDPQPAGLFLVYGSIPPSRTIYKEISALEPRNFLIINEKGIRKDRYYNLKNAFLDTSLSSISEEEAIERVHSCLIDTIRCHLVSDVPVGCFLSGGIDSSSIVALMREAEHKPIKTVSVIFPDTPYDESTYSKAVAKKFNTDHAEIEINGKDLTDHMERIFCAMDQPTIDGVNTYFVSWATAQAGLKVAMSGVGGDEIFWGYSSFLQIPKLYNILKILSWVPLGRRTASFLLRNSNNSRKTKLYSMVSNDSSIPEIYLNYRGLFTREQIHELLHPDFAKEATEGVEPASYLQEGEEINNESNRVSFLETTAYMANQLLRDTDVFSMAHSLEIRVPFVDHTLVELLANIPIRYKANKDMPKRLLIKALNCNLPDEIVHRPKMGFTFPFDLWMRRELRGFIEERLNASTIFNRNFTRRLMEDFCDHRVHWSRVWGCVVLNHWFEKGFAM